MKEGQQRRKFIRAFTVDAHIVPFLRPNLSLGFTTPNQRRP